MLKERIEIINRKRIEDSRGYFLKVLTGKENGLSKSFGEIYLTMAYPNEFRGGHYHKLATEWFTIIEGRATLIIEDINTNEKIHLNMDSKTPSLSTMRFLPRLAFNLILLPTKDSRSLLISDKALGELTVPPSL